MNYNCLQFQNVWRRAFGEAKIEIKSFKKVIPNLFQFAVYFCLLTATCLHLSAAVIDFTWEGTFLPSFDDPNKKYFIKHNQITTRKTNRNRIHQNFYTLSKTSSGLNKFNLDSDTVSTYQVSSVQLVTDKKLEAFNKA